MRQILTMAVLCIALITAVTGCTQRREKVVADGKLRLESDEGFVEIAVRAVEYVEPSFQSEPVRVYETDWVNPEPVGKTAAELDADLAYLRAQKRAEREADNSWNKTEAEVIAEGLARQQEEREAQIIKRAQYQFHNYRMNGLKKASTRVWDDAYFTFQARYSSHYTEAQFRALLERAFDTDKSNIGHPIEQSREAVLDAMQYVGERLAKRESEKEVRRAKRASLINAYYEKYGYPDKTKSAW